MALEKLNIVVEAGAKALASTFNKVTAKVDAVIDYVFGIGSKIGNYKDFPSALMFMNTSSLSDQYEDNKQIISIISVSDGDIVNLKASADYSLYYAVLKSYPANGAYDNATGYDGRQTIGANQSATFTIPSDAKYLIFGITSYSGINTEPQVFRLNDRDMLTDYITTYIASKQDKLVVGQNLDDKPVEDGTNPIISGAVYTISESLKESIGRETESTYDSFTTVGFIQPDGSVLENESYRISDYIKIDGQHIIESQLQWGNEYGGGIAFYNSNKIFISLLYYKTEDYAKNTIYNVPVEEIPEDAVYIRANALIANDSTYYVKNTIKGKGQVYEYIDNEIAVLNTQILDSEVVTNYDSFTTVGFIQPDGTILALETYRISDYIEIDRQHVIKSQILWGNDLGGGIAFYDKSKNFISLLYYKTEDYAKNTIYNVPVEEIPEDAVYIRATSTTANDSVYYVENTVTNKGEVYQYIDDNVADINDKINESEVVTNYDSFTTVGFIQPDGSVLENESYRISDYIKIDRLHVIKSNLLWGNEYGGGIAFYDENKFFISSLYGKNTDYSHNTVYNVPVDEIPSDAVYIRGTINNASATYYINNTVTNKSVNDKIDDINTEISNVKNKIATQINITTTDTQSEIIAKLFKARDLGNCDVIWEYGVYTFDDTTYTELKSRSECKAVGAYELPLGGNCHYYFNNATLKFSLTEFDGHCNGFGCIRKNCGNYYLYDGIFECTNLCYCVHDEGQAASGSYIHEYHNMRMIQNNNNVSSISKCIGGGTGLHGKVVIEGCTFISDEELCSDDCSWHGVSTTDQADFEIIAKNNYFSKRMEIQTLGENQTAILFFSSNSIQAKYTERAGWTIYDFCNEIR